MDDYKVPDMEQMIEECRKKQLPDEEIVFAFGVGRMVPLPFDSKEIKKGLKEALKFIKKLDGFKGVHPVGIEKNLLIFDTLNNAKGGRNLLKQKDVSVGNIAPILVQKIFLEGGADEN